MRAMLIWVNTLLWAKPTFAAASYAHMVERRFTSLVHVNYFCSCVRITKSEVNHSVPTRQVMLVFVLILCRNHQGFSPYLAEVSYAHPRGIE